MGSSRAPSKTTASKRNRTRKTLLSSTRPGRLQPAKPTTISSSAGRAVIRSYHTLHKRLSAAVTSDDHETANSIRQEINALGGLNKYQDASFAGQGKERGGDTSEVLVTWLSPSRSTLNHAGLKMLEVGALDVNNACARCGFFRGGIERIDLHSRHPDIKEQDFMERPVPLSEEDKFDVVSLSLVVNFVGDLRERGDMLRRVSKYLRVQDASTAKKVTSGLIITPNEGAATGESDQSGQLLPALFLVLPAPCVNNSRYLDEERLAELMGTLGYSLARRKMSAKLVYYLWRFHGTENDGEFKRAKVTFAKEEIKKGKSRNNFAIVLR